jgi:hypothetical protein
MIESHPASWFEELDREAAAPEYLDCPCARLAASQADGALSDHAAIECLEDLGWPCPNAVPVGGTFVYSRPVPALC